MSPRTGLHLQRVREHQNSQGQTNWQVLADCIIGTHFLILTKAIATINVFLETRAEAAVTTQAKGIWGFCVLFADYRVLFWFVFCLVGLVFFSLFFKKLFPSFM